MRPPLQSPKRAPGAKIAALLVAVVVAPAWGQNDTPPQPPEAPVVLPEVVTPRAGPQSAHSTMRPAPAHLRCPPGATTRGCAARQATINPVQPVAPQPQHPLAQTDDVRGSRFVPPAIQRFLADRRLDTQTRAFLRGLSAKPTEEWTLQELQTVTQLVPTLTELSIPTRVLSDFYEFLGLDPTELFEPKLGSFRSGTGFDRRNYDAVQQAQCFYLLGYGETIDPSAVTLKDLAACTLGSQ